MTDRIRLRDRGQVYVTLTAARTYADAEGLREEEARRELTELLIHAHETQPGTPDRPASYRLPEPRRRHGHHGPGSA